MLLPALLFAVLAIVALMQLLSGRDIAAVPSALIGRPAPTDQLEPLGNLPLFALAPNQVTIVNVWASWCAPCREENGLLLELTKDTRFQAGLCNLCRRRQNACPWLVPTAARFLRGTAHTMRPKH